MSEESVVKIKGNRYAKQWLDPRWQKRRLEIMQRDGFCCSECDADDKTLNVHHVYYTRGADVWDYPDHALVTLCNDCHESEHAIAKSNERALIDSLKKSGIRSSYLNAITFTINQLHTHIGQKKTKTLIEMMDFILFRPVCDEAAFGEIEALFKRLKPKRFFSGMDEE